MLHVKKSLWIQEAVAIRVAAKLYQLLEVTISTIQGMLG